ncbi:lytic transglycosylase domain-containing protein [Tianweitania sp. Rool2]|uniref:Lytic transglycosylase domain-containing protein n=2 Tax=Oryzicola mucosus TaxID=2767425 RepID=A0A8J6TYF0_9HYPH|nr:lytic transglycosylase domain-containing protein [Oryzicola mucosus]
MKRNTFFLAAVTIAAGAQLSGCSTTSNELSTSLAPATQSTATADADLALPDTVAVVPVSYAAVKTTTTAAFQTAQLPTAQAETAEAAAKEPAIADATPENAAAATTQTASMPAPQAVAPAPVKAAETEQAPKAEAATVAKSEDTTVFPPAPTLIPTAAKTATAAKKAPAEEQPEAQLVAFAKLDKPATIPVPAAPAKSGSGLENLIVKYAALYEVPVDLVRSVVKRESNFRAEAYNKGHWGLMQIKHATARGMGYDGPANGLLDAETNLKYSVKYLRGAFMVADGDQRLADKLYQRGYYFDAKRKGLLDETGLGRDRVRSRKVQSISVAAEPDIKLGLF